ncbi:MAG: DUF523 domain-containing protein [Anaerolineales bacterium]|jgi:uncharacterized protein YbbK (DUF523 family)
MSKKKILVSACLLGELVRYNSEILPDCPSILKDWEREGRLILVCPEILGGLPVPRAPSEIQGGEGKDVVAGIAKVININGQNVTNAYLTGAREALRLAEENGVEYAILKAHSPSCGNQMIYDGSFTGSFTEGQGVTAALLVHSGIQVFNEKEIDQIALMIDA